MKSNYLTTMTVKIPREGTVIRNYLRLIEEGLTYSDVLLMLKWYKVLPR